LNCDLTFWLDAHISSDLASYLGSQFKIIVKSTQEIDLHEAKDHVIYAAGRRFNRIVVVTKDEDFVELVERLGSPPQVVWLTVGNTTNMELRLILSTTFAMAIDRLMAGAPIVEISR
jgi:predicted nuclease of predicted toxin-antitoxin system